MRRKTRALSKLVTQSKIVDKAKKIPSDQTTIRRHIKPLENTVNVVALIVVPEGIQVKCKDICIARIPKWKGCRQQSLYAVQLAPIDALCAPRHHFGIVLSCLPKITQIIRPPDAQIKLTAHTHRAPDAIAMVEFTAFQ